MKFKPPQLPANPSAEAWQWWKNCFTKGLEINEITEDNHKLTFLMSHVGADFFTILEAATSYEEALRILDKHFKKPTRVIYARHQLLSSAQKSGESILDFVNRLKNLIQKCECKEVKLCRERMEQSSRPTRVRKAPERYGDLVETEKVILEKYDDDEILWKYD